MNTFNSRTLGKNRLPIRRQTRREMDIAIKDLKERGYILEAGPREIKAFGRSLTTFWQAILKRQD